MKLLKVIVVIFLFYFIRRFFQMYKVMKAMQERQSAEFQAHAAKEAEKKGDIIEADFKIIK